ncbi:hypothetical protein QEN19_000087 [Hanseniaspora menglaensis]
MVELRRSSRIKNVSDINYEFSDDDEYMENLNEIGEEEDDYHQGNKRKFNKQNGSSTIKRSRKGGNKFSRKELEKNFKDLQEDFVPSKIFNALAFEETEEENEQFSVSKLVKEWLDIYEQDATKGRKEIVNLILNCCGSLVKAEDHDVNDTTTAESTVTEFEIFFQKQAIFEFYLLHSKNTDKKSFHYKNLFINFNNFFNELILEADQRGLLVIEIEDPEDDDDELTVNPLIFDLLIWFSKFSVSKINPFRFASTIALYNIQTAVISLIPSKIAQTQSLSKMIAKEEKKKRKNSKAIDNWNEKLQSDMSYINILKSIVDDSLAACFDHRIRDTDEIIRSTSIKYLEKWMEMLPSKFYHNNYLKCYGWLIADISSNVKSSALISLANTIKFVINKNNNVITPLESFIKKYISKLIDITINDSDMECRILAAENVNLLIELGWVSTPQSLKVSSLIFMDIEYQQIKPVVGAKNRESRFMSIISKIFYNSESKTSFKKNVNSSNNHMDEEVLESENEFLANNDNIRTHVNDKSTHEGILSFFKFFLDAFSCFLAVSNKVATYESFDILNSQIEVESFESFQEVIIQAMKFLSVQFNHKLRGMAKFIINKNEIKNDKDLNSKDMDLVLDSIFKTDFLLIILNGFCQGLFEFKKNSSIEFAPYVLQHLPLIFNEYMTTSSTSNQISQIIQILKLFTHDQFSNDSILDEITSSCQKTFLGNMALSNDDVTKKNAFTTLFLFFKQNTSSKYSSYWENETQKLMDNTMKYMENTVYVNPKKYADTQFDKFTKELFFLYVNKLVIMLRFFEINITERFWVLFEKSFVNNIISFVDELQDSNIISFEIYFVRSLTEALQIKSNLKNLDLKSEISRIVSDYNKIKSLLAQLYHIEYDADVIKELRLNLANNFLDIKLTYDSVLHEAMAFDSDSGNNQLEIDFQTLEYLKESFIYQESKALNMIRSQTKYNGQELMNLCTLVLKIKNVLINSNASLLDSNIWQRVLLKANKLGPDYMIILN